MQSACRSILLGILLIAEQHVSARLFAVDEISFLREIRPILSENCYKCHGPDEAQREGGLRLDVRDNAIGAAESGKRAVVPGSLDDSELIARIDSSDPDLRMPPPDSGKALTVEQRELFKRWIAQGAKYQSHWAFTAPVRAPVPAVRQDQWPRNAIDRFVLAKLESEGLVPSPTADKATLIRRATLDLTGLPPTPSEVADFLADASDQAFDTVLDRLLSSPHYGERMALPWLDHARYADSNGYQSDGSRDIWAWRDWVIAAFNRNLPFDHFTIEQLAGDMLPNASKDQTIATGFNRNHRLNGEGGRIEAEWFVETVIDRVETTGLTWLGLTFNCCRCHDHKYDPISQKEFYQLFAFFNSVDESGVLAPVGKGAENTPPLLSVSTPENDAELQRLELVAEQTSAAVEKRRKLLPELLSQWESKNAGQQLSQTSQWQQLVPQEVQSEKGATLTRQEDGSYLASGQNPANDVYKIAIPLVGQQVSGLLLETLPDKTLPNESLGRGSNGNFVLTEIETRIEAPALESPRMLRFKAAQADYEQTGWTADALIRRRGFKQRSGSSPGWAIDGNDPEKRIARRVMLTMAEPVSVPLDAVLHITMRHDSIHADHNVGRFRWSITDQAPSEIQLHGPANMGDLAAILKLSPSERSPAQSKLLETYYLANVANPIRQAEETAAAALQAVKAYRESLPTTMIMKERDPRDAFVLVRGQYDRPGEKVQRGLPAILPPLPAGEPMNRLGLARWIVHLTNPLTARVWINRQWERLFGTGLVKTTENFGSQAEFPSHPELLDWLACEFMQPSVSPNVAGKAAQAWDMKAIQKLIMQSATYQQQSRVSAELYRRDPDNRWLARGPRFRLTGELVRDQILAASGLLSHKIGGPSVRPYMPEGVWDETSKYGNLRNYKHDTDDGLYRRTLYTIWKRTAAPPTMLLFDAPNRESCSIKRSRTNTPLQALSLLNEVTFVEAARSLAVRMLQEGGGSPRDRLDFGFRVALARRPNPSELDVLVAGYEQDLERFRADPPMATKLLGFGESKSPPLGTPIELAALTLSANVLLNLDEFVTRE